MRSKQAISMPGLGLIGRELAEVEKVLAASSRSEVRLVMDVAHHILDSGGKRFRPALALLSGRLVKMRRKRELVAYAAGLEFAHTSTLLHDDVIDEADLRRGRVSANRAFGNPHSIIVGDYLLFRAFTLFLSGRRLGVISFMAGIAGEMAEGEAYQLTQKSRVDLSEAQYERIIRSKTAILIQASCQVPAIAVNAPPETEQALARFGYQLGLAFQIVDDALDYGATDALWGKQAGKDFLEGKATLPLILAYHRANPAQKKMIKALFKKPNRNQRDFARVQKLLARYQALPDCMAKAKKRLEIAKQHLTIFPPSPARLALLSLADYVADRSR